MIAAVCALGLAVASVAISQRYVKQLQRERDIARAGWRAAMSGRHDDAMYHWQHSVERSEATETVSEAVELTEAAIRVIERERIVSDALARTLLTVCSAAQGRIPIHHLDATASILTEYYLREEATERTLDYIERELSLVERRIS